MRVLARSGQQAQGVDGGLWGAQSGVSRIAGGREGESGEGVGRRVAENRGETLRPPTDRLDETGRPEPTPSRVIEALEIPPSPPPPPAPTANLPGADAATSRPPVPVHPLRPLLATTTRPSILPAGAASSPPSTRKPPCSPGRVRRCRAPRTSCRSSRACRSSPARTTCPPWTASRPGRPEESSFPSLDSSW